MKTTLFEKILIANRGEIACCVIKTAKRMGIEIVAVFSEADREARHVQLADEAVCIGPKFGVVAAMGDKIASKKLVMETKVNTIPGFNEAFEGFAACRTETLNSFGDDRVFIKKFVEGPRHIEIQILGDANSNIVYLWERDCSIQRCHQKIIEEALLPFIDPAIRKAMGE